MSRGAGGISDGGQAPAQGAHEAAPKDHGTKPAPSPATLAALNAEPVGRLGRMERRILGPGREPDPRYSLANERTFLAYIRTALTLLGGGVAVEAFAGDAIALVARRALALGLVCLGMAISAAASYRWVTLERAMRLGRPLPLNPIGFVLAIGVTLAAIALAVSIVLAPS